MNRMVNVKSIDTTPEEDDYPADPTTFSALWIDPDQWTCGVEQRCHGGGTPYEQYVGHFLVYHIDEDKGRSDAGELRQLLKSEIGQALLIRICDGWYTEYDGQNDRGHLDDDAEEALEELLEEISELETEEYTLWDAEDWLLSPGECGINGLMTKDELNTLAKKFYNEANDENVVINDSILYLITEWRDESLAQYLSVAEDLLDSSRGDAAKISHRRFDENTLEVVFNYPDGDQVFVHVNTGKKAVIVNSLKEGYSTNQD